MNNIEKRVLASAIINNNEKCIRMTKLCILLNILLVLGYLIMVGVFVYTGDLVKLLVSSLFISAGVSCTYKYYGNSYNKAYMSLKKAVKEVTDLKETPR